MTSRPKRARQTYPSAREVVETLATLPWKKGIHKYSAPIGTIWAHKYILEDVGRKFDISDHDVVSILSEVVTVDTKSSKLGVSLRLTQGQARDYMDIRERYRWSSRSTDGSIEYHDRPPFYMDRKIGPDAATDADVEHFRKGGSLPERAPFVPGHTSPVLEKARSPTFFDLQTKLDDARDTILTLKEEKDRALRQLGEARYEKADLLRENSKMRREIADLKRELSSLKNDGYDSDASFLVSKGT